MRIDSAPRSGTSPLPEQENRTGAAPVVRAAPDGEAPASDLTPAPGADQAQAPGADQAQAPGADQAQAPGADQAQAPGADQAQAPGAEEASAGEVVGSQVSAAASQRRPLSSRARLWIVIGIAALALTFLVLAHSVLRPFVWAAVLAYILNPVVGLLQRRLHVARVISASIVMLVLVGLLIWGLTAAVPTLRSDATALTTSLTGINTYLITYLQNAGTPTVFGIPVQVTSLVHNAQLAIADVPHLVLHDTMTVVTTTVGGLLRILTCLISTFYLVLDGPRLRLWLRSRIPARHRVETVSLAEQLNTVLQEYLRAQIILIAIMSVASLIALSLLGVHFALLLAPIVGFLEIFPIIGPFSAITLVGIVALVGPANFGLTHVSFAVIVVLVFFTLRQLEDYLVIPNVVGHAVKIHPVLILFAVLSGAALAGILGMFLAVPLTGALRVLGSYAYDRLTE